MPLKKKLLKNLDTRTLALGREIRRMHIQMEKERKDSPQPSHHAKK